MNYQKSYESPVLTTLDLGEAGDMILCTSGASQNSIMDMSVNGGLDNNYFEI